MTDLERLALRLRGTNPTKIRFETVPQRSLSLNDTKLGKVFIDGGGILELVPTGQTESVGSVQILEPQPFAVKLNQLKQSATPAAGSPTGANIPPPAVSLPVPASQVLVTVETGTGTAGPAGQARQALAQDGFRVSPATSTTLSGHATSEILYPPGQLDAAQTLAAAVPGAVLRSASAVTNGVLLVLGANYHGISPLAVAASTAPTPPNATGVTPAPDDALATAASPSNRCTY